MSILVHRQDAWRRSASRASTLSSIVAIARSVVSWPRRVHANRALLARMAGMSAYELADIGLTPGDVRDTVALPLDSDVGQFLATRAEDHRRVWRVRCVS